MLECVTFAKMVEFVVQMLVDLPASTILHKKTAENSESSHPNDLAREHSVSILFPFALCLIRELCIPWHTSIRSTFPFTKTTMSTNSSSSLKITGSRSRVHSNRLANDEAIGDELPNGLAGVCVADLVGLVGVQPVKPMNI